MGIGRLFRACLMALMFAAGLAARPAVAPSNFARPGAVYLSPVIPSGDPADCALLCERDKRCHAWSFNYPTDPAIGAMCWLKGSVPARIADTCCVSGIRGAGVVEPRTGALETSIDRPGGDYKSFDVKTVEGDEECRAACTADTKRRRGTFR